MVQTSTSEPAPWQVKVAAKRKQQLAAIPKSYLAEALPEGSVDNVIAFARDSGKLSERELEITELDDVSLLAARLAAAEYSAVEVATAYCKRAALAQQVVNCLTEIFFERALARARELDDILGSTGKVVGPLHGVPVSLKDQANVIGMDTTIGVVSWIGKAAKMNSVIVDILLQQGAVLYCKTQIPLSLMLAHSKNNVFGRSLNPHNRKLTAGGSSGGEGSIISFKGSPLGVGTDILGSIRIPAYACGVYGLKPSSGRIPYRGLAYLSGGGNEGILPAAGPLARSVEGIELFMSSILASEPWSLDPAVVEIPWRSITLPTKATFAMIKDDRVFRPHPPIARALDTVEEKLKAAGHDVIVMDVGDMWFRGMMLAFEICGATGPKACIAACEESGEPIYDEIVNGPVLCKATTPHEMFEIIDRKHQLQEQYSDMIRALAAKSKTGRIDAVISPVAGHCAPPLDKYSSASYHVLYNLLDHPAGVIPVTTVDPEIDAVTSEWRDYTPYNELDAANKALYPGPELYADAPVCLQVASTGRLQEERCVAAMKLIAKLL